MAWRTVAAMSLLVVTSAATAAASTPPAAWVPPIEPLVVLRRFDPPDAPWAAGHRGVDVAARPGAPVRAPAAGVVTFAGVLAGRGVVVVAHADGTRSTFEPVRPVVAAGTSVRSGATVATLLAGHPPAGVDPPGTARLHWGLRRGDDYLDPLGLLRRVAPVLLPYWQVPVAPPAARPRSPEHAPLPEQPDATPVVPVRPAEAAGGRAPLGVPMALGLTGAAAGLTMAGARAGRSGGRGPRGRRARRVPLARRDAG